MNLVQLVHDILITDGMTNLLRDSVGTYDVFQRYKLVVCLRNQFNVTKPSYTSPT